MTEEHARNSLSNCRDRIDTLDRRIVDLLNQRASVAREIGTIKQAMAMPVYEPKREDVVFQNVMESNAGPLTGEAVRRIFERIIDEMRVVQRIQMEKGR
ncbi:MAG: chorismate mutase [Bryobacteraceae bacterium]